MSDSKKNSSEKLESNEVAGEDFSTVTRLLETSSEDLLEKNSSDDLPGKLDINNVVEEEEGKKSVASKYHLPVNHLENQGGDDLSLTVLPENDPEHDLPENAPEHVLSENVPEHVLPEDVPEQVKSFYIGYDDDNKSPKSSLIRKLSSFSRSRKVTISDDDEPTPKKEPVTPVFTPPDGGFGWTVAFSAFFLNAFIIGFIKSYGVLYVSIAKKFPDASAYQISWIPVCLGTFGLLIAPITGYLCRRFTSRKVAIFGGFLIFLGIFCGSFAKSIIVMICTFGLLTGFGYGLTTTPAVLVVSLYFEKRRTIASAICVSGNAFGGFIFPPLLEYLITMFQFEGAMLIVSALMLHICAFAIFFRPISVHALVQEKERRKKLAKDGDEPVEHSYFVNTSDSGFLRNESFLQRFQVERKKFVSESSDAEDEELHRQVSFLRTASMMHSIPDLALYAKSFNASEPIPELSRPDSSKPSIRGNKSSLFNITSIINNNSQLDLTKGAVHWVSSSERLQSKMSTVSIPSLAGAGGSVLQMNRLSTKRHRDNQMPTLIEHEAKTKFDSGKTTKMSEIHEDEVLETFPPTSATPKTDDNQKTIDDKVEVVTKVGCCTVVMSLFDFSLMKKPIFLVINASMFLFTAGNPHALFLLPAFATSLGIDKTKVVSLLSISSIVDLFGRLLTGFVADTKILSVNKIYFICTFFGTCSVMFIPLCTSFVQLAITLSVYGFGVGAWFVMIPSVLIENFGKDMLSSSYSLVRMFQGFMNFISPQIIGLLFDATDSYTLVYFYMGICMGVANILLLLLSLQKYFIACKNSRKVSICEEQQLQPE